MKNIACILATYANRTVKVMCGYCENQYYDYQFSILMRDLTEEQAKFQNKVK